MHTKIFAYFAAVLFSLTLFSGCDKDDGKKEEKTNTTTLASAEENQKPDVNNKEESELKAPVSDSPINVKDGPTENMYVRSVLRKGNLSRIASKIDYALANKKEYTDIVFIGDSITAGSSASSSSQYVNQFTAWWEKNISFYVNTTNAGIGATDTYLAVHRAERDVLSKRPDIIFIEFINDANNDFYKTAMDSLVRKCLACESNPAVILIEMTMEDGTSPQGVHVQVAEHYDIPVISYRDAILPEIEAGNFTWKDISPDNIHPNDAGHKMLAKLIENFITVVKDELPTTDKTVDTHIPEALMGDKYADATLANRDSDEVKVTDEGTFTDTPSFYQNFTNGWGTTTGGLITFEVEAKNIGMVYNKNVSGTFGIAKISVDGVEVKTINADFPNGWGSYACMEEFFTSDQKAKHIVTIEIGDTGKTNFDIYSLLIS